MNYFALIDPRLPFKALSGLKKLDIEPVAVPITGLVDEPVSGHPDIQLFLHNGIAFVHPDIDASFVKKLDAFCEVRHGAARLSRRHPGDIAYNIAVAGDTAFHRLRATDSEVSSYLSKKNIRLIDVKQGYTKCSTLIADDRSIITADRSIHNAAIDDGLDSLLITPGHINLPGYKYGFIGGISGRIENTVLLTGNIDHHPDREEIYNFIESKGLSIKLLSDEEAIDTGSILVGSY